MPNNEQITEVTAGTFVTEVLEASRQQPVLVDFWADWCQPCRQLSPLLASLAVDLAGKLKVVKINTDTERELAAKFGIRNLPTVMLIKDGQVVDQFSGLVPKSAIQGFLERHLPRTSDSVLQQAQNKADDGDLTGAITVLREALAADPDNDRIPPQLIGLLMKSGEYEQAQQLMNSLPANQQHNEEVKLLRASLTFLDILHDAPDLPTLDRLVETDPGNLESRYQLTAHKVMTGDYETAMEQLLEIIRRDRSFRDDGARKSLLDIFTILGNSGELVKRYRSKLALLLN